MEKASSETRSHNGSSRNEKVTKISHRISEVYSGTVASSRQQFHMLFLPFPGQNFRRNPLPVPTQRAAAAAAAGTPARNPCSTPAASFNSSRDSGTRRRRWHSHRRWPTAATSPRSGHGLNGDVACSCLCCLPPATSIKVTRQSIHR